MSINGTVVIYPESPTKATTDAARKATATSVIDCLIQLDLLRAAGAKGSYGDTHPRARHLQDRREAKRAR